MLHACMLLLALRPMALVAVGRPSLHACVSMQLTYHQRQIHHQSQEGLPLWPVLNLHHRSSPLTLNLPQPPLTLLAPLSLP